MVFFRQIKKHFKTLKGRRLAFWGLAFKNRTDDLTCSPAVALAKQLLSEGAYLKIYDPFIGDSQKRKAFKNMSDIKKFRQRLCFCKSAGASLKNSEGLICGSAVGAKMPLKEIKKHLIFIVDGRNVFKKEALQAGGFVFYQAGSPYL